MIINPFTAPRTSCDVTDKMFSINIYVFTHSHAIHSSPSKYFGLLSIFWRVISGEKTASVIQFAGSEKVKGSKQKMMRRLKI